MKSQSQKTYSLDEAKKLIRSTIKETSREPGVMIRLILKKKKDAQRLLFLVMLFSIVIFSGPLVVLAEYDPLAGLGYDPTQYDQTADTSGSLGVTDLETLLEGINDDASDTVVADELPEGFSGASEDAGQAVTAIAEQIQKDCTEAQIASYQPQMDACFGGKDACNSYTSPGCAAEDAAEDPSLLLDIPLACFFECLSIKMVQCQPVFQALLDSCHGVASAPTPVTSAPPTSVQTTDEPTAETSGCTGENKIIRNDLCVCTYGYQKSDLDGQCVFITSGANLDADGIEKINDAAAVADSDPNGAATTTITVNGKELTVGVSADPNNYGTYRYTTDGIHYFSTLQRTIAPGFLSRVGNGLLDGTRRGLTVLSPFNWFTGRYKGDDKEIKYDIGRQVVYDDLDAQRHSRIKDLKYMNDFLNGMALYMDLRAQGKSKQQIMSGDQDLNLEINQATNRLRTAGNRTDKSFSDEDKNRLQAAHDAEMYQAFEDGYLRYQLQLKMQAK